MITDIVILQPDTSVIIRTLHMARPKSQELPTKLAITEQTEVDPISSGDTVAMDYDITMVDGLVDEGYHTNHEHKKIGES